MSAKGELDYHMTHPCTCRVASRPYICLWCPRAEDEGYRLYCECQLHWLLNNGLGDLRFDASVVPEEDVEGVYPASGPAMGVCERCYSDHVTGLTAYQRLEELGRLICTVSNQNRIAEQQRLNSRTRETEVVGVFGVTDVVDHRNVIV